MLVVMILAVLGTGILSIAFGCFKKDLLIVAITNVTIRDSVTKQGDRKYCLFGHETTSTSILFLGVISISIWLLLGVSFWSLFLYDISFNAMKA